MQRQTGRIGLAALALEPLQNTTDVATGVVVFEEVFVHVARRPCMPFASELATRAATPAGPARGAARPSKQPRTPPPACAWGMAGWRLRACMAGGTRCTCFKGQCAACFETGLSRDKTYQHGDELPPASTAHVYVRFPAGTAKQRGHRVS